MRLAKAIALISFSAVGLGAAQDDEPKERRRVRIGGISVGASYIGGSPWYPYYGYPGFGFPRWGYPYWNSWAAYDPFLWSPWIHPGLYGGFAYGPNMGEVKLSSPDKDAAVYVDGAYAGPASRLKSIWLDPGVYNIEVKDMAGRSFSRKIYVLTGKTLPLKAELREASK